MKPVCVTDGTAREGTERAAWWGVDRRSLLKENKIDGSCCLQEVSGAGRAVSRVSLPGRGVTGAADSVRNDTKSAKMG